MKKVYNIISIEGCQLGSDDSLIVKINPVTFIYTGMRYLPTLSASESSETEYVIFKNQSYIRSYLMDMVEHCKRHDYLVLNLDGGIFDIQKTNINDRGVLKVKTIYIYSSNSFFNCEFSSYYSEQDVISISEGNYNENKKNNNTTFIFESKSQRRDDSKIEDVCFGDYTLKMESLDGELLGNEIVFYIDDIKVGNFVRCFKDPFFDVNVYYRVYRNKANEDKLYICKCGDKITNIRYDMMSMYADIDFYKSKCDVCWEERHNSVLGKSEFFNNEEISHSYKESTLSKNELISIRMNSYTKMYNSLQSYDMLKDDESIPLAEIEACRNELRKNVRHYHKICGKFNTDYVTPYEEKW